jgi:hypothetical protein
MPAFILALTLIPLRGVSQEFSNSDTSRSHLPHVWEYLPPLEDNPLTFEVGAGFGVPYGVLGGRASLGSALVSGDIGLGIVPIAWDVSMAVGASVHLLDRYSAVNLRLTVEYTTTAAYIILQKKTASLDLGSTSVFYKEGFPGYAVLGGVDIRFGSMSELFLSLNIGVVASIAGKEEVERKYNQEKALLAAQGYTIDSETISLDTFPKIAIGLSYVFGRTLVLR